MAFVRARKGFRYRSARIEPGDVIEVPDKDLKLLVAVGRAEEAEKPRGRGRPPKPKDEAKDEAKAEPVKAEKVEASEPERAAVPEPTDDAGQADDTDKAKRGRYARRDLTADDE